MNIEAKNSPLNNKSIKVLIDKLSKHYVYNGVAIDDLKQEGWLAIVETQSKWENIEPDAHKAYLTPFIRRAMLDYSVSNNRLVKIIKTHNQRKALFNLRNYTDGNSHLSIELENKISEDLNVSVSDVRLAFGFFYNSDEHITVNGKENDKVSSKLMSKSIIEMISNESDLQDRLECLYDSMGTLSDKENIVIRRRWLEDKKSKQTEISTDLNLTVSGVSFLESNALKKLKRVMTENKSIDLH